MCIVIQKSHSYNSSYVIDKKYSRWTRFDTLSKTSITYECTMDPERVCATVVRAGLYAAANLGTLCVSGQLSTFSSRNTAEVKPRAAHTA